MPNLSLEGCPGSGKSHLLQRLKQFCNQNKSSAYDIFSFYQEPVSEWSKAFEDFQDGQITGFQLQTIIQTSLVKRLASMEQQKINISERSLASSNHVFAEVLKNRCKMTTEQMQALYRNTEDELKEVLIIHVTASVSQCLKRIAKRRQDGDSLIDFTYMLQLHKAHEKWLRQTETPVMTIDNDNDADETTINPRKILDHILEKFDK